MPALGLARPGAKRAIAPARPAPRDVSPTTDDPLRGILLILAAVLLFSCSDATAKYLSAELPVVEIAWIRYIAFCLIVLAPVLRRGRAILRVRNPGLQLLRGLGMVGSTILFIFGLQHLPMAEASAISFVSPICVTALSIPLLGEVVGIRRWAAVVIGLLGVLIVIRPGTEAFQLAALYPLLSAACWAVALVITRKMAGSDRTSSTLIWSALSGMAVVTALLPFEFVAPTFTQVLLGAFIGLVSTGAQWLIVLGYRYAGASVLAPFSYTQLLWSAGLGFLVFGSVPSIWTFAGAAVITASGLYTAHRERLRARKSA